MTSREVRTVEQWHEALNAGDADRLVALSTEDVEVGGPRGSGQGSSLLREWFGRAGIRIHPVQYLSRGTTVVVEQDAIWGQTPESQGAREPQRVSSVFVVRDGRVASVFRYPTLADALRVSGLTQQDRI